MNLTLANFSKPPHGRFLLTVFHRGIQVEHTDDRNLIVDGSKFLHARLLGGDVTGHSVSQIGFGTNGSAPAAGNSALTGPFLKTVDAVSYPAANSVQFDFSLASGENNGMAILEFGLVTTDGALYARKVRNSVLSKTTDISLTGSWIITF